MDNIIVINVYELNSKAIHVSRHGWYVQLYFENSLDEDYMNIPAKDRETACAIGRDLATTFVRNCAASIKYTGPIV